MIIASTSRFAMSRHHIAKLVKKLVLTKHFRPPGQCLPHPQLSVALFSQYILQETDFLTKLLAYCILYLTQWVQKQEIQLLLCGQVVVMNKIIEVLTSDIESHSEVPRTVKENVYFLVDHNANLNRKANAKYMKFWDNCGTWDTKFSEDITLHLITTRK